MTKRNIFLLGITVVLWSVTVMVLKAQVDDLVLHDKQNNDSTYELAHRAFNVFQVPKQGIIHIGARFAEELDTYVRYNIEHILWIEADPSAATILKKNISKHYGSKVAMFAATDTNGFIDLHVTNNYGHSSSIFELKNHLHMSPDVAMDKTITVPQKRLDDYLAQENLQQQYNVIVIDVQGAELIALKGAIETLKNIDAIIAEVNYDELYSGGVFVTELDSFLANQGFTRVETFSVNKGYGNALYVKHKLCTYGNCA